MATPNLALEEMTDNQNNKEVTFNNDILFIEQAVTSTTTKSAAASPVTITTAEAQRSGNLTLTGAASGGCTVNLPDVARPLLAKSATDGSGVVTLTNTNTVKIVPGEQVMLWLANNDILLAGSNRHVMRGFIESPGTNARLLGWVAEKALFAKSTAPQWQGVCAVAPSSSTTYTLNKNGASAGSLVFSASATSGSWSLSANLTLAAGDLLTLHSPANNNGLTGLTVALPLVYTD